ncbi:TPA: peptidase S55 SpoIVB, partial [Candidatus Bipolaricaulota bacterium]|nr:peptidase S55 SpoIVB [Candidatus Bipolaricaulota bacterium]
MKKLILMSALVIGGVACLGEIPEIVPLAEVTPGMTGYGLTVVAGEELSQFQVEVVGVIDQPGTANDFIIVRVWGDAIERSGG